MKIITKYVTDDGCEFSEAEKAFDHENLVRMIKDVMHDLPVIPCRGRVAVSVEKVAQAKRLIVEICRMKFPNEDVFKHDAKDIHPMSYAGRFLSDVGGPLDTAWHWFMCQNGEWLYEQPYFAINPHEFKEQA